MSFPTIPPPSAPTVTLDLRTAGQAWQALSVRVKELERQYLGTGGTEDRAFAHGRWQDALAALEALSPALAAADAEHMARMAEWRKTWRNGKAA